MTALALNAYRASGKETSVTPFLYTYSSRVDKEVREHWLLLAELAPHAEALNYIRCFHYNDTLSVLVHHSCGSRVRRRLVAVL